MYMATTKKRLNISMSKLTEKALDELSKRDNVPQATKAAELIEFALEIEEDVLWGKLAKERDTKDSSFVKHSKSVWE